MGERWRYSLHVRIFLSVYRNTWIYTKDTINYGPFAVRRLRDEILWVHLLMFDCYQLVNLTSLFFPSAPHLGKLIRKPGYPLLWHRWDSETTQTSALTWKPSLQPPPTTVQTPSQSPSSAASSHFTSAGVSPLSSPRRPRYVSNKPHTLLIM